MAETNIEDNFDGGYSDLWKMTLYFAAAAAIYPKLGFVNRKLYIKPSEDIQDGTIAFLQERGYVLESQTADVMTFRIKGIGSRLIKMCEDRITITRTLDGYYMEGLRKDVIRYASGLEYLFQNKED